MTEETRIYIDQAREILGREMDTLRKWDKVLPEQLRPSRGARNVRYWTPDQIEGIKKWIIDTDRRPGKGIPSLKSREKDEAVMERIIAMRKPRGNRYTTKKEEK